MTGKIRYIYGIGAAVLLLVLLSPIISPILNDRMVDFEVFYKAGQRFLAADQLYQATDGHYQFKYMPFAACYFIPLALLPLTVAKYIWMMIILAASLGIYWLSFRLIILLPSRRGKGILLISILILARFFVREIELGQVNAVFVLILLSMMFAHMREKIGLAGLLLGIAITIKPYALIFFPYFLYRRQYRLAAVSLGASILALLLPIFRYGFEENLRLLEGWQGTLSSSTPQLLTNQDNVSLFGMFAKWFGTDNTGLVWGLALAMMLLIGIALWYAMRQNTPSPISPILIESSILLILIPLFAPQGWDYVFLAAAPGIMILLQASDFYPKSLRYFLWITMVIIALGMYDILGRSLYAAYMQTSIPTICFLILVMALIILRAGRAKSASPAQ